MTGPRSRLRVGWCGRLAAACLPGLAACGPPSNWQGFAPTGEPVVEVSPDGAGACVWLRGEPAGCFDGVSLDGLALSRDGMHLALPVREGTRWRVVRDGVPGDAWDGVTDVRLTPDGRRLAYGARSPDGWRVVVDGAPGPPFDSLTAGSLRFDPTGERVAYTAWEADEAWAVVDGERFGPYTGVGALRFSGSGIHVAFVARLGELTLVVRDGALLGTHGTVSHLAFAPAGPALAYVFRDRRGWWLHGPEATQGPFEEVRALHFPEASLGPTVVVGANGRERFSLDAPDRWFGAVEGPAFDSAGRTWGYIGQDSASSTVVVSGRTRAVEPWATDLVLSPDGRRYAYLAHGADGTRVVDPTDSVSFELVVPGSLAFFGDGTRWSCLVGDVGDEELWIAAKGAPEVRRVEWSELMAITRGAAPGGASARAYDEAIRTWVAQEAERHLGTASPPGTT